MHAWRHNDAMPSVQIKDVPDETHAVLRRRAAAAHQSLQEYLRSRLIEEASRPTLEEVLERAGGRAGGSVSLSAAARARLSGESIAAPELIDLEMLSVLRRQLRTGSIDERRADLAQFAPTPSLPLLGAARQRPAVRHRLRRVG